jgi:hypothetical protein
MLIIYRIIDEGQKERTAGDDTSEMEKGSRERERERASSSWRRCWRYDQRVEAIREAQAFFFSLVRTQAGREKEKRGGRYHAWKSRERL